MPTLDVYVLIAIAGGDWQVAKVIRAENRADAKTASRKARRQFAAQRPLVVTVDTMVHRDLGSFFGRAGVAINGEQL